MNALLDLDGYLLRDSLGPVVGVARGSYRNGKLVGALGRALLDLHLAALGVDLEILLSLFGVPLRNLEDLGALSTLDRNRFSGPSLLLDLGKLYGLGLSCDLHGIGRFGD